MTMGMSSSLHQLSIVCRGIVKEDKSGCQSCLDYPEKLKLVDFPIRGKLRAIPKDESGLPFPLAARHSSARTQGGVTCLSPRSALSTPATCT